METETPLPSRLTNTRVLGAAALAGTALLLVGFIPHQARALLLTDGQVQAKAFAAAVAPLDPKQAQIERDLLNRLANQTPRRTTRPGSGFGTGNGSAPGFATPGKNQLADAGLSNFPNPNAPDQAAFVDPGSSSGGTPGAGPGLLAGTTSSSGGTTSSGGGQSPLFVPNAAAGTPKANIVAAVPEPSTWMSMLTGFFIIGLAIRRKSNRKQSAVA